MIDSIAVDGMEEELRWNRQKRASADTEPACQSLEFGRKGGIRASFLFACFTVLRGKALRRFACKHLAIRKRITFQARGP